MLFAILKAYARLALWIYCRKIVVNKPAWLRAGGPLLLACNHPNSFLDGIILTTLFEQNIYSLARGDAFRKPWHGRVLQWIHLLPVYRTSEGVENLGHNYSTFEACKDVFRQGGIVIIFSEGRCINEWKLRPLKKGTARLSTSAWDEGINLTVLPVGLNYSRFRTFGKNVFINFGHPLNRDEVMAHRTDGQMFLCFNEQLRAGLQELVTEVDSSHAAGIRETFSVPVPPLKIVLLAVPALAGAILHAPLYFAAKAVTQRFFDNDHFDSVLISLLFLAYPFYVLAGVLAVGLLGSGYLAAAMPILLPFFAWSCVQLKPQH